MLIAPADYQEGGKANWRAIALLAHRYFGSGFGTVYDISTILILGLALSNGLIGLAGSLLAQYQGFADVQMGIGMVVWGLASVIIGEALVGSTRIGLLITGAVMGSVLFRLLVAIALRWGLNPNDLKLISAVFVLIALILPALVAHAVARARRADASAATAHAA